MTKGTAIFLLGLLVIILPALGVPMAWKQIAFGVMGIIMLGIGYSLRRAQYLATLEHDGVVRTAETFVETTEPLFDTAR
jgi:predicted Na+-dependent transporter